MSDFEQFEQLDPPDMGDLHDVVQKPDIKGAPIVRHISCGSALITGRLSMRHGRLQGLPLVCRKCGEALTARNIEPVNAIARGQMIYTGAMPDPARPVSQVVCDF